MCSKVMKRSIICSILELGHTKSILFVSVIHTKFDFYHIRRKGNKSKHFKCTNLIIGQYLYITHLTDYRYTITYKHTNEKETNFSRFSQIVDGLVNFQKVAKNSRWLLKAIELISVHIKETMSVITFRSRSIQPNFTKLVRYIANMVLA